MMSSSNYPQNEQQLAVAQQRAFFPQQSQALAQQQQFNQQQSLPQQQQLSHQQLNQQQQFSPRTQQQFSPRTQHSLPQQQIAQQQQLGQQQQFSPRHNQHFRHQMSNADPAALLAPTTKFSSVPNMQTGNGLNAAETALVAKSLQSVIHEVHIYRDIPIVKENHVYIEKHYIEVDVPVRTQTVYRRGGPITETIIDPEADARRLQAHNAGLAMNANTATINGHHNVANGAMMNGNMNGAAMNGAMLNGVNNNNNINNNMNMTNGYNHGAVMNNNNRMMDNGYVSRSGSANRAGNQNIIADIVHQKAMENAFRHRAADINTIHKGSINHVINDRNFVSSA